MFEKSFSFHISGHKLVRALKTGYRNPSKHTQNSYATSPKINVVFVQSSWFLFCDARKTRVFGARQIMLCISWHMKCHKFPAPKLSDYGNLPKLLRKQILRESFFWVRETYPVGDAHVKQA